MTIEFNCLRPRNARNYQTTLLTTVTQLDSSKLE